MPTIRRVDPSDPKLVNEDGEPLSKSELVNRHGMVQIGEAPDGDLLFDCGKIDSRWLPSRPDPEELDAELPGEELAHGRAVQSGRGRYEQLPPDIAERCIKQVIYRDTSGADLRSRLGTTPQTTVTGHSRWWPSIPHARPDDDSICEQARLLADDPDEPVERLRVPVGDVKDTDIIDQEPQPAHRFM